MRDPYKVLGLGKSADKAEIKRAYRKLAKENHPDRHSDDAGAQARFAEINQAYEILSDKEKRAQYDSGMIDAEGNPKFSGFEGFGRQAGGIDPRAFAQAFGGGTRGFRFSQGPGGDTQFEASGFEGAEDLLHSIFGGMGRPGERGAAQARAASARGKDVRASVAVTLEDIAAAKKMNVSLPGGRSVAMSLPKGVRDGQVIRLKGQGAAGSPGARGDALITVKFVPHPLFRADGSNLRCDLPVDLADAVLGARLAVPTLDGKVHVRVPAQSSSGKVLRLKGKGLPSAKGRGDLLVRLLIALPDTADPELSALMEKRRKDASD